MDTTPKSAPKSSSGEDVPTPDSHDPDQAWFWTAGWQAGERAADADIKAGRVTVFESPEAFLASLDEDAAPKA
jgi:hypothetical protein